MPNTMQDILTERLEELGITRYQVAKQVLANRGDTTTKVTQISSTVNKTFESPETRQFSTLAEIVEAMGGEFSIRWHSTTERRIAS